MIIGLQNLTFSGSARRTKRAKQKTLEVGTKPPVRPMKIIKSSPVAAPQELPKKTSKKQLKEGSEEANRVNIKKRDAALKSKFEEYKRLLATGSSHEASRARDALILEAQETIRCIALKYKKYFPQLSEDMPNSAFLQVINTVDRTDINSGKWFVKAITRSIVFGIFDHISDSTLFGERKRRHSKQIPLIEELQASGLTNEEIVEAMKKITINFEQADITALTTQPESLDKTSPFTHRGRFFMDIPDPNVQTPEEILEKRELRERLKQTIDKVFGEEVEQPYGRVWTGTPEETQLQGRIIRGVILRREKLSNIAKEGGRRRKHTAMRKYLQGALDKLAKALKQEGSTETTKKPDESHTSEQNIKKRKKFWGKNYLVKLPYKEESIDKKSPYIPGGIFFMNIPDPNGQTLEEIFGERELNQKFYEAIGTLYGKKHGQKPRLLPVRIVQKMEEESESLKRCLEICKTKERNKKESIKRIAGKEVALEGEILSGLLRGESLTTIAQNTRHTMKVIQTRYQASLNELRRVLR